MASNRPVKNGPEVRVPLPHRDPFQHLFSTILSAQCTDAMVTA